MRLERQCGDGGRCFESQAEELGLYIWVMAEGWVSRGGSGAGV